MEHAADRYVLAKIHVMLCRLGANPKNMGTFQTAYAIYQVYRHADYIGGITTRLYPRVAAHYQADPRAVERNVRYTIHGLCRRNRMLAVLLREATPRTFLSFMALHLQLSDQLRDVQQLGI